MLIDQDISSENESLREGPWPNHKRGREDDENSDSSSSNDSSDSNEDNTDVLGSLPRNTSLDFTAVTIPDRSLFTREDYTKSYSLKAYDMPKPLRKELKKINKWWTKECNAERKGAKPIGEGTADKREERILCFMGSVNRYTCLRDGEDHVLTTARYLNHRLFEAYLDYLKEVRELY